MAIKLNEYEISDEIMLKYTISTGEAELKKARTEYEAIRIVVYYTDGSIHYNYNNNGPDWKSMSQAIKRCNEINDHYLSKDNSRNENLFGFGWYGYDVNKFMIAKVCKVKVVAEEI